MLKKLSFIFLVFAILMLIPVTPFAQEDTPYKFYVSAKYWNQENFPDGGNTGMGFGAMFDVGPHVYVCASYGQINFCGDSSDVKILGAGGLWFPPISENWSLVFGGSLLNNIGIGNPYSGTDVMWSVGAKYKLWTLAPPNTTKPGSMGIAFILSHTDVELLESWVTAELMVTVSLPVAK